MAFANLAMGPWGVETSPPPPTQPQPNFLLFLCSLWKPPLGNPGSATAWNFIQFNAPGPKSLRHEILNHEILFQRLLINTELYKDNIQLCLSCNPDKEAAIWAITFITHELHIFLTGAQNTMLLTFY